MFGRPQRQKKLEIDTSGTCSSSASILQRLDRIADNYERLDSILDELEQKLASRESEGQREPSARPRKPR